MLLIFIAKSEGFPCPCCGFLTLDEPANNTYSICPVCYWEDDDLQNNNPDLAGGANKECLKEARCNFKKFKASSLMYLKKVRSPIPNEIPDGYCEENK